MYEVFLSRYTHDTLDAHTCTVLLYVYSLERVSFYFAFVCCLRRKCTAAQLARSLGCRAGNGGTFRMSDADFADYESKVTFMFPGQGAQYMGMAANICQEVPHLTR